MRKLISYLWSQNRKEILARSLKNCHAMGLDSIMLLEAPGKTVRLFIATKDHTLWRNIDVYHHSEPLSVAFHPHHCNVMLHCIRGTILNWTIRPGKESSFQHKLDTYHYSSKIGGEGKFIHKGESLWDTDRRDWIQSGHHIQMDAGMIHTVGVERNEKAAWFVFEGQEDPGYCPLAYSNHNPNEDFVDGMYLPMTEGEIYNHLNELHLFHGER